MPAGDDARTHQMTASQVASQARAARSSCQAPRHRPSGTRQPYARITLAIYTRAPGRAIATRQHPGPLPRFARQALDPSPRKWSRPAGMPIGAISGSFGMPKAEQAQVPFAQATVCTFAKAGQAPEVSGEPKPAEDRLVAVPGVRPPVGDSRSSHVQHEQGGVPEPAIGNSAASRAYSRIEIGPQPEGSTHSCRYGREPAVRTAVSAGSRTGISAR